MGLTTVPMTPAAPQQLAASVQPTAAHAVHTPASAIRAVTLLQSMATAGVLGTASAVVAAITSPRPSKNPPAALPGFKWLGPTSQVLSSQAASLAQNPFQINSLPPTALAPQPQAVSAVPTTNVHFA